MQVTFLLCFNHYVLVYININVMLSRYCYTLN